ncbi:Receptor-type tyrosine-protein phosphatase eta [Sciurus carolinensis]|uniref:Receptor-type tyrosine-protein phosphatase eta n=1 Tax=Sciurus carolinensis TaxID=30640 RepID=A0AA41T503_SCICA|nr:Receptor-type tyrosine-protein phosphatase eta [Sciurus carolinensis]
MVLFSSSLPFLRSDPSAVFGIRVVHVTTTEMRLEWQNTDGASAYVYHLVVQSESGSREVNSSEEAATLQGLIPSTLYNITISPEASQVRGQLSSIVQYTQPAPVTSFHCEMVFKEPAMVLKWACPPGTNEGFELGISSGAWDNVTLLESCSPENGTEYWTEVTYLNFSTSYNFSITTLSCEKMTVPTQNTCVTGITALCCEAVVCS